MSFRIPPSSPRKAAAAKFAAELDRAMKSRSVGRRRLAEVLGMSSASIIAEWRRGAVLPRLDSAARLAAALKWPALEDLARAARTHLCPCGTSFTSDTGGRVTYCSPRCQTVAAKKVAGVSTRYRADAAERKLVDYVAAVDAMCRWCEPEGLCGRPDCALRPVSPLPLERKLDLAEVAVATPASGPYGSPENRARTTSAIRAGLARRWSDPQARVAQAVRMRAWHAGLSADEREDLASRISSGRKAS